MPNHIAVRVIRNRLPQGVAEQPIGDKSVALRPSIKRITAQHDEALAFGQLCSDLGSQAFDGRRDDIVNRTRLESAQIVANASCNLLRHRLQGGDLVRFE